MNGSTDRQGGADQRPRLSHRGAAARLRLLAAAAAEMVAAGEIEVAAVARRAGVSVGLPYRYFGTRSGLVAAVVADFYDRLEDAVILKKLDGELWQDRERARVTAWVTYLYADPLAPVVLGRLGADADVAVVGMQRWQRTIEVGSANIAHGQRSGELPDDRDPELLAAAVLGGMRTTVAIALTRTPRLDRDRVVEELWAFVSGAVGIRVAPVPATSTRSDK